MGLTKQMRRNARVTPVARACKRCDTGPMLRALLILPVLALPALGQGLDDRHLPVIPRTAAEAARVAAILAPPSDFTKPETFEAKSAGAATVRARATTDAFSQLSANMPFEHEMDFKLGNALFRKTWVASPASTLASDGLGPLYNARACQDCHLKDGRGHPPEGPGDGRVSMFLRLSLPGGTDPDGISEWLATQADPAYGGQLQDLAAPGHAAEGQMTVSYTDLPVTLGDGTTVTLRAPIYGIADAG